MKLTQLGFVLFFLCACSQPTVIPQINLNAAIRNSTFVNPIAIPPREAVFYLTPEQKQDFLAYFNDRRNEDRAPHQRIYDYIERTTYNFHYQAQTNDVRTSLQRMGGNCMSLALVTSALANLVAVPIRYEMVDSTPVFEKRGSTIVRGVHIRSKLYLPAYARDDYRSRGIVIDYFPSQDNRFLGNIDNETFISIYYANIAAELLAENRVEEAYWYAIEAVKIAPYHASNISNLAVVLTRAGLNDQAEELFLYGIALTEDNLVLLKNYKNLLLEQGRPTYEIQKQIDDHRDPSPYPWINLAEDAYERRDFRGAKRYYKKALILAPYLQYAYLGLAKVAFSEGDYDRAIKMLEEAKKRNTSSLNERVYNAKLEQLMKNKQFKLKFVDTK